jgi:hypothetical protein
MPRERPKREAPVGGRVSNAERRGGSARSNVEPGNVGGAKGRTDRFQERINLKGEECVPEAKLYCFSKKPVPRAWQLVKANCGAAGGGWENSVYVRDW